MTFAAIASASPNPSTCAPKPSRECAGASAYRLLEGARGLIERVIVIRPSHFVPFAGVAVPNVKAFETPLGLVPIDDAARANVLADAAVVAADRPHAREHSLEVQLWQKTADHRWSPRID